MKEKSGKINQPMRGGGMPMGFGGAGSYDRATNAKATIKKMKVYVRPQVFKLLIVVALSVISTIFTIMGPDLLGNAIDEIAKGVIARSMNPLAQFDLTPVAHILLILLILYVISAICSFSTQYVMSEVAQKMVYQMRNDVKTKLDKLPLKYFDNNTDGEIMSRTVNDMENIATSLQQILTQFITSLVTIVGIFVMMLRINILLSLVALVSIPVCGLFTILIAKKSQKFFIKQQNILGQLNGHTEEMLSGHKIVKAFGYEKISLAKFSEMNAKLYKSAWMAQFMGGVIFPVLNFTNNLAYVAICVMGGKMIVAGTITVGGVQAFIQYIRQFTQPIVQTANIANVIQAAIASGERIFEVLDQTEELPDIQNPTTVKVPKGDVKFHNVKFGYSETKILIEDMNINVKAGQTVAIVGPTGAGKTTLVNLMLRFYELLGGSISIDEVNINNFARNDLRKMFGMVLQDAWVFHGTIKENIAYGCEEATDEQIKNAAKAAHIDRFIKTLPQGYNTVLNEEASNISQGQKQLLTIARAILANSPILILDEATSSVDTRTEVMIQKAMNNLVKGQTGFIIAHRLSTIRNADLIIVMDNGKVVEQGTHEQLLNQRGFYAELHGYFTN